MYLNFLLLFQHCFFFINCIIFVFNGDYRTSDSTYLSSNLFILIYIASGYLISHPAFCQIQSLGSFHLKVQEFFFFFCTSKTSFSTSAFQTHQHLHQPTMVARAQARATMTWIYSAPWCPTPSQRPHQQLSLLR